MKNCSNNDRYNWGAQTNCFLKPSKERDSLTINNSFGDVELIKTISELIASFKCEILKVNTEYYI